MSKNKIAQENQCHICEAEKSTIDFVAQCSNKKCKRVFCEDCIITQFDQTFEISNYNPRFWICYKCQDKCVCAMCNLKPSRATRSRPGSSGQYFTELKASRRKKQIQSDKNLDISNIEGDDEMMSLNIAQISEQSDNNKQFSSESIQIQNLQQIEDKVCINNGNKQQQSVSQNEQEQTIISSSNQIQSQQEKSSLNVKRKLQNNKKSENKYLRRKRLLKLSLQHISELNNTEQQKIETQQDLCTNQNQIQPQIIIS